MLEEYIKEIESDLQFDEINLKDYQLRLPSLKHKWAGRCIRHKLQLINLKKNRDKKKQGLVKTAIESSAVTLSLPIVEKTVDKHSELVEIDIQVKELELVIELLEKTEKTFSSTTWDISNLIKIVVSETQ